ncbi:MAG: hypothetical protein R2827_11595 [Bdellovibrionales bacterium]
MAKAFLLLLIVLAFSNILRAGPFDNAPGLIPNSNIRQAATDLTYQGQRVSPLEVEQLQVDTSTLQPAQNTILWNEAGHFDSGLHRRISTPIQVENSDTVQFISPILSISGFKRDLVETESGQKYRLMFSPRIHNVLLRKKLLEKLGYFIPPVKYIKKLKVKFSSNLEMRSFLSDYSGQLLGVPNRWVTNIKKVSVPPDREAVKEQVELGFQKKKPYVD